MNYADILIAAVILGILVCCGVYILRSKKKGKACIGCPDNCACSARNCSGGCKGCQD